MKRFLMILLLFVFIVSMTACSSSGEEKNVQKNSYPTPIEEKNEQKTVLGVFEPEELLPQQDVEKLLNMKIEHRSKSEDGDMGRKQLRYYNENKEQCIYLVLFQQSFVSKNSDFNVITVYNQNKANCLKYDGVEPVDALGDDAYYDNMSGYLTVLLGEYNFKIDDTLSDFSSSDRKAAELELARIVEKNLKEKLEK